MDIKQKVFVDTGGWLQKIWGVKNKDNIQVFKRVFDSNKYLILTNQITNEEFRTKIKRDYPRYIQKYEKKFTNLLKTTPHKYLKMIKTYDEYWGKSQDILNKTDIKKYFEKKKSINRADFEPLILLRDYKIKNYTIFTGDMKTARALRDNRVMNILKAKYILIKDVITFDKNKEKLMK